MSLAAGLALSTCLVIYVQGLMLCCAMCIAALYVAPEDYTVVERRAAWLLLCTGGLLWPVAVAVWSGNRVRGAA